MTKLKMCVASVNWMVGDWSQQMLILRQAIEAAKKDHVGLLVFPELAICGPDAQDIFLRPQTAFFAEQVLSEIVAQTQGITVVCGMPLMHEGRLYNVAAVLHDGCIAAFVPKRYPQSHTDEDRYFSRWDFNKSEQHLGAVIGTFQPETIGIPNLDICVGDIALHPAPEKGAILAEINNCAFAPNRYRDALSMRIDYSRRYGIQLVRANMLGSDDGTHIYDGGGYILSRGAMVALAPRFALDQDYTLTTSDDEIPNAFDPSLASFQKSGSCPKAPEDYVFCEMELAIVLALNDYMRRAHIQRLCLALSGGRDSAMIAILIARLVAVKYPGATPDEHRAILNDLLVSAYLPSTASSSGGTQQAAIALAQTLGFRCPVIPITPIAIDATTCIENTIQRDLSWEHDDLTLQNVQSRARALIIWTLANASNAMLLTTGNMSEAAVGYATMDGDSSGCLDPIGSIPKTIVSQWLQWARNFHNIPALDLVFAQPPSAELRPLEKNQSDEADLMPYHVLDTFVDWFVVRKMSPKEMFTNAKKSPLAADFKNDDHLRNTIKRFVSLMTTSQWKRNRFANSFLIFPFDLSPASGLRWPCLQAPFIRACDEM